ncbi:MAG: hypothetical protein L0Y72_19725 [Gemmataceae bacterium]|nr:hypothetical protein [Gemmataceae bacterium]MCI0741267.1 hypothetical protein [Gemmataceae bacterium]
MDNLFPEAAIEVLRRAHYAPIPSSRRLSIKWKTRSEHAQIRQSNVRSRSILCLSRLLWVHGDLGRGCVSADRKLILLHAHFTADEIERGKLRVAQVIGNQEILFSNGERRPFGGGTKALRAAVLVGLAVLDFALVSWALAHWHNKVLTGESAEK